MVPQAAFLQMTRAAGPVRLYTAGVKIMNLVCPRGARAAAELSRQAAKSYNVEEALIVESLAQANFLRRGEHDCVVVIDCRELSDPRSGDRYHCGTPPRILHGFVSHRNFPGWLDRTMRCISRNLSPGPGTLHVIFYCAKGRHRSVAGASVVLHLFEGTRGAVRPSGMTHTSREYWSRYCDACAECTRPPSLRNDALASVRTLWARSNRGGAV